jgi:hypothetical protein
MLKSKKLRILILAANPRDFGKLQLDREVRQITAGLRAARGQVDIHVEMAAKAEDVRRAMLSFLPTLVHFSGYGAGSQGIYFENEEGGAHLVSTTALAEMFRLFSKKLSCVVLNACYSEKQAAEIARHVDYVIGMVAGIGDHEAIEFSTAFYETLGAGESIEFSYSLACNSLQLRGLPAEHHPVLLMRKRSHSAQAAGPRESVSKFPEVRSQSKAPLRVFLCHASEDKASARSLHQRLHGDGFRPWLDELDILPGEDWDWAIRRALGNSDAVLVLLSRATITKAGYLQKEIRLALEICKEQPPGAIYLIPAKIESCEIPDHLTHLQTADLTKPAGYDMVLAALRKRMEFGETRLQA